MGASVEADSIWDLLFFKPKIRKIDSCMPAFMAALQNLGLLELSRSLTHRTLHVGSCQCQGDGHEDSAWSSVDFGHALLPVLPHHL